MPRLFAFLLATTLSYSLAAQQTEPLASSLIWEITRADLKQPSYLYGTIHMIAADKFFWPDSTLWALSQCERLSLEIEYKELTSPVGMIEMMPELIMADGAHLSDFLNPEEMAIVKAALPPSMPISIMARVKPLFVSSMFDGGETAGGGNPFAKNGNTKSYEKELYTLAKKQKMRSDGLESAAYQLSMIDSIPLGFQAQALLEAAKTAKSGISSLDTLTQIYLDQNIEAMGSMINEEGSGDATDVANFEEFLLNRRNRNWIPVMSEQMHRRPTFFAVGAGHLGGTFGVIRLLQKAGYTVRPVGRR
jgi:uncharacterized protein